MIHDTGWIQGITFSTCFRAVARMLILVIMITGSSACGTDNSDLREYISHVKKKPPRPIEPIPEFEIPEKFTFPEDTKRRSPFKPLEVEDTKDIGAPDVNRPRQPLEAFPLDSLKFVGIFKVGKTTWGLISQPSGLISRVKSGDYMGKNHGQIIRITDDKIMLEETVQVSGKWQKRSTILKLKEPG